MNALELDHITKTFSGHLAVDDVSLRVPTGVIHGFIGPNGAGKTTTLRMIMDIIRPDAGTLTVLGERDPAVTRARIGYLPEERGMYKKMHCLDFVAYIGKLKGMRPAEARERGAQLMDQFELGKWKSATVDALSKGMQQKLQFVSTIVHEPELLILDEPFSGLDPVNLEVITDAMLQYRRRGGTVIFSTHMMEHAERLCDSLFMIHRGRKVLDGPIRDIKSSASHPAIRLRCFGDASFVRDLPYVTRVREQGSDLEVFLDQESNPQILLQEVVKRVAVMSFDIAEPSLYDIFLELAGEKGRQRITADGQLVDHEEGTP